ncbi:hypothetical protein GPECTOR_60g766 [Gonium pectorale]|uniref:Apple domain-containing protein n=1 Tax=Gonium pectorale TaxID=33097 RepID=A0A150G565_GONPE|nr:hypothetical protein GPECTOR_60g766 [Gonium pectorale]|eukprot:KXZ44987.1 hypothetical protein GPECTOR_60g766 [Gonium pectorale]
MFNHCAVCGRVLLLAFLATAGCGTRLARGAPAADGGAPVTAAAVAVANRDVEGSVVVDANDPPFYTQSAADCRNACTTTQGCNLWTYCAAVDGCRSGNDPSPDARKFRQCWLKYDKPPSGGGRGAWPRAKNARDQSSGWLSGTTERGVADDAGRDHGYSRCSCKADYVRSGSRFKGVCSPSDNGYGASCPVDTDCQSPPSDNSDSCPTPQRCAVLLDTDLEGKALNNGDFTYTDSPEACCALCAGKQGCNIWTWCGSSQGCNGGQLFRFRQCWLKAGDPTSPAPKGGYGSAPGWLSGVRLAWLPA